MKRFVAQTAIIVSFVVLTVSGCATSYQAKGLTGGFTETRVSENTYQVQFEGNGYTSQEKTSRFILRRAAELTLENGERYFNMTSSESQSTTSGYDGMMFSAPSGKATVRILDSKEEAENPFDAVIVVEETNEVADGKLSEEARKTYRALKSQ
jgi:hypothetical protein